ncbi:hypothetical protein Slin15195_G004620 [Septoria linicola]|uniref:Uncharacterized protein n=1 Tax=Septoria linicola TaxID=215465 RepID=A0A9Q9AJ67_9PEZI|nr:hypothetical protein Slin14017_G004660 [Septoria linicola]USW47143.1 hypothetical protein Slin15195_G004620 [Septoria linicola]
MAEEEEQPRRARPESTIAQSFAADLDSMFGLGEMDTLSRTIEEKKSTVSTGQLQLQELEARLRETEQRLAKVSRQNSPARRAEIGAPNTATDDNQTADNAARPSPLAQKPIYPADRPPTADRPPSTRADAKNIVSNVPQQQYNGSNEYVMVDRSGGQAQRGYG